MLFLLYGISKEVILYWLTSSSIMCIIFTPREYTCQYDYMAINKLKKVIEAGYPEFEVSNNRRNI